MGRQYLGNVGQIDKGVVSVSSLWADEQVYSPLEVKPTTPAAWFECGRTDPDFKTKLTIAMDLVKQAVTWKWPFKAGVADSFYAEDGTVPGVVCACRVADIVRRARTRQVGWSRWRWHRAKGRWGRP